MKPVSSYRPTREWLLLILAIVTVGGIVVPLWDLFGGLESREELARKWTPQRLTHLLLGPEQVVCYVCFLWAGLILLMRYWEVLRQRKAFSLNLLPTEAGARILPEDARPLLRKLDQLTGRRPYILANLIRLGLGKYAVTRSASDVVEVVQNQADVEMSRLSATMATVHYLAWAIPAVGFVGTVRGLGGAFGAEAPAIEDFIAQAKDQLKIAFDCTLIALVLSLGLMFLLHFVQRAEETLVVDAQEYCQEHLLLRLYDPSGPPAL
jgi:biopolymer transport protein ExbB/TolQ